MKTVLLRAPLLSQSGYGVHARQVARWLFDRADKNGNLDITTELLNWGGTPWYVDTYAQNDLIGRCFQASATQKQKKLYDVTIQLQLPNEWCPELGKVNIGMTAGVEADRCNPKWIEHVNKMTLVIVPSEFTKSVFMNSGKVTTPIVVVPEAFFDKILESSTVEPLDFKTDTAFNFLVFGQITGGDAATDRKNLPFTLKWLFEVFADKPDVGIVLKTNMGRYTKADEFLCKQQLTGLLSQVNKGTNPKLYLLHGEMNDEEVVRLYKHPSIKALVTLTHGEGFGLPILEAAASGVPVIASGWSAHTEFLGQGKYIKVDTKVGAVPPGRFDNEIWMPGSQWGIADEEDFKKRVLKFYENSTIPKQWAEELQGKLLKTHSFQAISTAYDAVLGSVV